MLNIQDQNSLFRIIGKNLKSRIECYAFGGTAMMYYGFKGETKDVDLLFLKEEEKKLFIEVLEKLGFSPFSPLKIYIPEKLQDKSKPVMYERDEFRFDIFLNKIFRTQINKSMQDNVHSVHEYGNFIVKALQTEHIVQLKAITERVNDLQDIKTILNLDQNFNWQYVIDECIWQHQNGDSWILLDMEKTIKALQKEFFIPDKYVQQLYDAQN